jgi:hypothetical protein
MTVWVTTQEDKTERKSEVTLEVKGGT